MMATFLASVRCLAALFISCAIMSFSVLYPTATQLEGKWTCDALTKQLNENTVIEKGCLGDLHFTPDRKLSSTCSAGFFPSGTRWKIDKEALSLADSYGHEFVRFSITYLDDNALILEKNSITYSFARSRE